MSVELILIAVSITLLVATYLILKKTRSEKAASLARDRIVISRLSR